MLKDFEYLCFAHGDQNLSQSAREYISSVRRSEPSRMVGTHARANVVSFLPSKKMQRTISTESRGPEKSFAILAEYDDRILEYYDQPEPISIVRTDKRGRSRKGSYTPDFLVLLKDGPQLVEVKTADAVVALAERYPEDWIVKEDGSVLFIPAEAAAEKLGLGFQVWTYRPSQRFYVANLELLLRARNAKDRRAGITEPLKVALKRQFAWTLDSLSQELGLSDLTALIQCIDSGHLYSDLRTQLLSQPSGCVVASSEILAQEAIELIDRNRITPTDLDKVHQSLIPSEKAASSALEKIQRIRGGESTRQARRWRALITQGTANGLSEFQSLLPKNYRKGNGQRKINIVVKNTLHCYLVEEHGHLQGISNYRSYIRYRNLASVTHPNFSPVHRKTFERHLAALPAELIASQRGGKRSGNASADASDPNERQLRAQLPWELASVDHYLADLYLVFFTSENTVLVERPWVTAMIDQATGSLLASTVSFMHPSKRSVAKIFRECVRMHGRLPQEVILDRGSEFKSVYLSSLLAHYKVGHSLRPASHARYGSEVERFFGEFKEQWLNQRSGNIADYKEARSVDGKLSPRSRAVLRPSDFIRELSTYRQWRENAMRSIHTESASQKLKNLSEKYPFIGERISYDSEFLMMTAIDTKDYSLDQRRGISTNGRWYYSPELRKLRGKKKDIAVRLDPENPNVIYASIKEDWTPCYSSDAAIFNSLDGPTQLAHGMTQLELSPERRKYKQGQSQHLAKLVQDMDLIAAQSRECPVALSEPASEGSVDGDDLGTDWLNSLTVEAIPPLKVENWELHT